jgi:hypothetical protein
MMKMIIMVDNVDVDIDVVDDDDDEEVGDYPSHQYRYEY